MCRGPQITPSPARGLRVWDPWVTRLFLLRLFLTCATVLSKSELLMSSLSLPHQVFIGWLLCLVSIVLSSYSVSPSRRHHFIQQVIPPLSVHLSGVNGSSLSNFQISAFFFLSFSVKPHYPSLDTQCCSDFGYISDNLLFRFNENSFCFHISCCSQNFPVHFWPLPYSPWLPIRNHHLHSSYHLGDKTYLPFSVSRINIIIVNDETCNHLPVVQVVQTNELAFYWLPCRNPTLYVIPFLASNAQNWVITNHFLTCAWN